MPFIYGTLRWKVRGLVSLWVKFFHFSLQILQWMVICASKHDGILSSKWYHHCPMDKSWFNTMLLQHSFHLDSCRVRLVSITASISYHFSMRQFIKFLSFRFLSLFGSIQLYMYQKYASPISETAVIPKSSLYNFQVFLLCFVPFLAIVRFLLTVVYFSNPVYGYMVSTASQNR